jgi:hypothetical protein
MDKTRKYNLTHLILIFVLLIPAFLPAQSAHARTGSGDVVLKTTVDAFSQLPCLSSDQLEFGSEILKGMDYNSQRIVRKISLLPGADFTLSRQAWAILLRYHYSYEQMVTFEQWVDLNGVTMKLALKALPEIRTLNYEAGKAYRAFLGLSKITPTLALKVIPLLNSLEEANKRAAQAFFSIQGMTAKTALDNLVALGRYTAKQAAACEAFIRVKGMTRETAVDALPLIQQIKEDDAWNLRTLLQQKGMNRAVAWDWLVRYFAHPAPVQEAQFYQLTNGERTTLLQAFYDAGEELIWKINGLHAITDEYGIEISQAELKKMANKVLYARFKKLSEKTRAAYGNNFYAAFRAGKSARLRSLLRQATTADRSQVCRDLTLANIYALLAQGSELYDSSFRDILVPILKARIKKGYKGNLLLFLRTTDPENLLVSSFIVSLAQKGKLTTFFPQDSREQEKILELVAASAFKDEDAILLFSATFKHLLLVLETDARNFLINKMVIEADHGSTIFTKLIAVILQYYLEEYPELLDSRARKLITRAIVRHGAVNLNQYLVTPFGQWKSDGRLGSISVFHPDDDGRTSFISNARSLGKHGYKMELSEQYTPLQSGAMRRSNAASVAAARNFSARGLTALFEDMRRNPFSVAFVKKINGITIRHSVYVYAGKRQQQELFKRFLRGGDEMFAQRGHSYWRSEQITDPLKKLQEQQRISDRDLTAKQRFLSLGSCGGVKAYTNLTRMFLGHIDILATIGTGMAIINDPYNRNFFEVVAKNSSRMTWKDMADKSAFIFAGGRGGDYLQPGSLTAILHKILDEEKLAKR